MLKTYVKVDPDVQRECEKQRQCNFVDGFNCEFKKTRRHCCFRITVLVEDALTIRNSGEN